MPSFQRTYRLSPGALSWSDPAVVVGVGSGGTIKAAAVVMADVADPASVVDIMVFSGARLTQSRVDDPDQPDGAPVMSAGTIGTDPTQGDLVLRREGLDADAARRASVTGQWSGEAIYELEQGDMYITARGTDNDVLVTLYGVSDG